MSARLDQFNEWVAPLARDGNEFAATALVRVLLADDPEAEADKVIAEYAAAMAKIGEALRAAAGVLGYIDEDPS